MHDKNMEIKEAQLQLLRKQLETGGTARASTPVRTPPRSAEFNSPPAFNSPPEEEEQAGGQDFRGPLWG